MGASGSSTRSGLTENWQSFKYAKVSQQLPLCEGCVEVI